MSDRDTVGIDFYSTLMQDKPSTDELLDEISLQDSQESGPTADFEMDGISAEEMADDAEQQEKIDSSEKKTAISQ